MKKNGGIGWVVFLFLLSLYFVPMIARQGYMVMGTNPNPMGMTPNPMVTNPMVTNPMVTVPSEIQVVLAQDYTDTLKNVYAPPIQYREKEFRQLGYLTAPNRGRLPLFGRVLNRRDKWAYYTLEQGIKLPIEVNRRICTQSPGCDSLSSGDEVQVEGVPFKVNLYESFLSY